MFLMYIFQSTLKDISFIQIYIYVALIQIYIYMWPFTQSIRMYAVQRKLYGLTLNSQIFTAVFCFIHIKGRMLPVVSHLLRSDFKLDSTALHYTHVIYTLRHLTNTEVSCLKQKSWANGRIQQHHSSAGVASRAQVTLLLWFQGIARLGPQETLI